jgi:hypothetical protein
MCGLPFLSRAPEFAAWLLADHADIENKFAALSAT